MCQVVGVADFDRVGRALDEGDSDVLRDDLPNLPGPVREGNERTAVAEDGGGHQDEAVHPLRRGMGDLEAVEDGDQGVRQTRDSEGVVPALAAAVSRQVGIPVQAQVGQRARGRQREKPEMAKLCTWTRGTPATSGPQG